MWRPGSRVAMAGSARASYLYEVGGSTLHETSLVVVPRNYKYLVAWVGSLILYIHTGYEGSAAPADTELRTAPDMAIIPCERQNPAASGDPLANPQRPSALPSAPTLHQVNRPSRLLLSESAKPSDGVLFGSFRERDSAPGTNTNFDTREIPQVQRCVERTEPPSNFRHFVERDDSTCRADVMPAAERPWFCAREFQGV